MPSAITADPPRSSRARPRHLPAWLLALTLTAALATPALAQRPPREGAGPPERTAITQARIAAPQTWTLPRASDEGNDWKIFLTVPPGEPPAAGWPVLYVLDGNAAFTAFTPAGPADTQPALVIVGIGYDVDRTMDVRTRAWDYLPTPSGQTEPDTRNPEGRNGGADAFLNTIRTRIQPEVAARTRIDASRQTLMGHSYGGVFALHALLSGTDAFQRYVIASPSFWYRAPWLQTRAQAFLAREPAERRVLFTVGSEERGGRAPPGTPGARDVAPWFAARWPGTQFVEFEGLGHGAAMPAALDLAVTMATAP